MTTYSEDLGGISAKNPVIARPYAVGIFDVLGFKNRFERLGLKEITARYRALIDIVVKKTQHQAQLAQVFPASDEGPYWCAGGEIVVMTYVHAAYASDTFLVWANHTWTKLHELSESEEERLAKSPNHEWLFHPIPCDPFLDTCNELMCRSLQVGLPLRGAVAVGDAILDKERAIFLGQPIIDATLLEHGQRFIGVGMCDSFIHQTIPKRFAFSFNKQIKELSTGNFSGLVLDWPRHWRNTRRDDLKSVIEAMRGDNSHSEYYDNSLSLVEESERFSGKFEPRDTCPIRSNYEQFSYSRGGEIAARMRAVRRITPEESAKLIQKTKKDVTSGDGA